MIENGKNGAWPRRRSKNRLRWSGAKLSKNVKDYPLLLHGAKDSPPIFSLPVPTRFKCPFIPGKIFEYLRADSF